MSAERGGASGMHFPLLPHPSPLISAQSPPYWCRNNGPGSPSPREYSFLKTKLLYLNYCILCRQEREITDLWAEVWFPCLIPIWAFHALIQQFYMRVESTSWGSGWEIKTVLNLLSQSVDVTGMRCRQLNNGLYCKKWGQNLEWYLKGFEAPILCPLCPQAILLVWKLISVYALDWLMSYHSQTICT